MTTINTAISRPIRLHILCLAMLCALNTLAQNDSSSLRKVQLPEVFIQENRELFFSNERSQQQFSESDLSSYSHHNLSEALSTLSIANINSYGGLGSTATISIRGTASDHTTVLWNGFQINSITLGESDISLIPIETAEQATILYSGASTLLGSGSFGGAILLNNTADWDNTLKLTYRLKTGSLKYHGHHLSIKAGSQKVQYSFKAFLHKALNDFEYNDRYKANEPEVTQTHNALNNYGFVQNLYIKARNNQQYEFGLWTQNKQKEIPPTMGRYGESNKLQDDINFRFYGQWRKIFTRGRIQLKSAFFHDYLHYTDKAKSTDENFLIDSRIKTKRSLNQAQYRHYFNEYFRVEVGTDVNVLVGDVISYGGSVKEILGSIYIDLQPSFRSFSSNLSTRQELDNNAGYSRPLFSVGLQQKLFNQRLLVQISYDDKYRKPDFNERYWIPGGNRNLVPEIGWGMDAGVKAIFTEDSKSSHSFHYGFTLYRTIIKNGIVWKPGGEGFWSPQNIEQTRTQGIENELVYNFSFTQDLKAGFDLRYHYNKTTNHHTGIELAYRPDHIVRSNIFLDHKYFSTRVNWGYTGKRYTDNSENKQFELADYNLLNIYASGKYTFKGIDITLGFEISNVTNTAYEVARTFATPGRSYFLNLTIVFTKPITKKPKNESIQ